MIVLDESINAQYVKVLNKSNLETGSFSLYDLRIFGNVEGQSPNKLNGFTCIRQKYWVFTYNQGALIGAAVELD